MASRRVTAIFLAAASVAQIGCSEDEECNSPTNLAVHSGDGQNGPTCAPLGQPLTVRVQCSNNQPYVASTMVEWQVDSGGGSVDPLTSATDATGRASTRLTLGPTPGENVVRATAVGLPPATFIAETIEPCSFTRPLPFGIRGGGELEPCDCQLSDGLHVDYHRVNVGPQQQSVQFDLESTDFDGFLTLFDASGFIAGGFESDRIDSRVRIIMRQDSYLVGANSLFGQGAYTLIAAPVSIEAASCELVWVTTRIWTAQHLTHEDCWSDGFYVDGFLIVLDAGQTVTIKVSSTEFDPLVCVVGTSPESGVCDDDSGSGNDARVVYTSPADDIYLILAATYWAGGFGRYSLDVSAADPEIEAPIGKQTPLVKRTPVPGAELNALIASVLTNARQPKPHHPRTDGPSEP